MCGHSVFPVADEDEKLEQAAGRLMEIADEIPFTPPDIETDSGGECDMSDLQTRPSTSSGTESL